MCTAGTPLFIGRLVEPQLEVRDLESAEFLSKVLESDPDIGPWRRIVKGQMNGWKNHKEEDLCRFVQTEALEYVDHAFELLASSSEKISFRNLRRVAKELGTCAHVRALRAHTRLSMRR